MLGATNSSTDSIFSSLSNSPNLTTSSTSFTTSSTSSSSFSKLNLSHALNPFPTITASLSPSSSSSSLSSSLSLPSPSSSSAIPSSHSLPSHFQDSLDYINHELTLLGFPSPLNLIHPSMTEASTTLNVIFMLLEQLQKDKLVRKEIEVRYQKLSTDYGALEVQLQRHKEKIQSMERESRDTYSKLSKTEMQLKESQEKCKLHTDELKLVKSSFQQAKSQFMHEKRKWERTQISLQQKLVHPKLLSSTNTNGATTFTVSHLQPLPSSSSSSLMEKDSFYHQLLLTSESTVHQLQRELVVLKQCLYSCWLDLESLTLNSDHPYSNLDMMPFELVQESIHQRLFDCIEKLKVRFQHVPPMQELEKLKDQVLKLASDMDHHHEVLGGFVQLKMQHR